MADKILIKNNKVLKLGNKILYYSGDSRPQLPTPTNLTASGTTITFDEVENATSYEVFADGVSIGEYAPVSG